MQISRPENTLNKLTEIILVHKLFIVNDFLKSETLRHHQMLAFFPGNAPPGLYCTCLHVLLNVELFRLQFSFQHVKCSLSAVARFGSLLLVIDHTEAFGWTWADNITYMVFISQFIPLLLSHHHISMILRCGSKIQMMNSFFFHQIFFFFHISATSLFLPHLLIWCFCRTANAFLTFLTFSNLIFLFLRDTNLVVKPLKVLWWSLVLTVDFDTDAPLSWRMFLI